MRVKSIAMWFMAISGPIKKKNKAIKKEFIFKFLNHISNYLLVHIDHNLSSFLFMSL